jgi:hypothetical protein
MAGASDPGEDYLSKAMEAEAYAAQAQNPIIKASWLKIAHGYRYLAEQEAKVEQKWGPGQRI